MAPPSPDLKRRIDNTENIVLANKKELSRGLYDKYPNDYMDIKVYNRLKDRKPWINPAYQFQFSSLQKLEKSKKSVTTQSDKILVLCVDFSDIPATISIDTIRQRYFGTGNSLKNYYNENSYGTYIPDGYVFGWYRSEQPYSYYKDDPTTAELDYGMGNYPHNSQRLFEDLLDIVNNDPNITTSILNYIDADNDNKIDRIMIVHAGGEAAWGGQNEIWAHQWDINPKTIKGKTFQTYAMSAEYMSSSTDTQRSGVDIHEYGHILGLPDLYDYNDYTNGVGKWSVMSNGSWGNNGITPVHFDCWCKKQMGWIVPTTDANRDVTLRNAETYPDGLELTSGIDTKQYFLIENRQKTMFDTYLPGTGLLIYRINENVNQYDNATCKTVSLLQADNYKDLENKVNLGDNGDPYPGISNKRSWNQITAPNTVLCNGTTITKGIDLIPDSSNSMTFRSSTEMITCATLTCTLVIAQT